MSLRKHMINEIFNGTPMPTERKEVKCKTKREKIKRIINKFIDGRAYWDKYMNKCVDDILKVCKKGRVNNGV